MAVPSYANIKKKVFDIVMNFFSMDVLIRFA